MAETNITKVPFRPVFCNEQVIKKKQAEPLNGHVYFTTDTKKIFLGQNGNFLPMCSSSGFFYGIKDILYFAFIINEKANTQHDNAID